MTYSPESYELDLEVVNTANKESFSGRRSMAPEAINDPITSIIQHLKEQGSMNASDELQKRLIELTQGRKVPIVTFNCIDFIWSNIFDGKTATYPTGTIIPDITTSIAAYFKPKIEETMQLLQTLGNPSLHIIIPDSEIFDDRPIPHAQCLEERQTIALKLKQELSVKLQTTAGIENSVLFWSEYCQQYRLPTPQEYTQEQYIRMIKESKENNSGIKNKLIKQQRDSRQHFANKGIHTIHFISDEELLERTRWYTAMYAGEGRALAQSRAILLNFEDGRVAKFATYGASQKDELGKEGKLAIITPIKDTAIYYRWRNNLKKEQLLSF